jgi:hypothetical protein
MYTNFKNWFKPNPEPTQQTRRTTPGIKPDKHKARRHGEALGTKVETATETLYSDVPLIPGKKYSIFLSADTDSVGEYTYNGLKYKTWEPKIVYPTGETELPVNALYFTCNRNCGHLTAEHEELEISKDELFKFSFIPLEPLEPLNKGGKRSKRTKRSKRSRRTKRSRKTRTNK